MSFVSIIVYHFSFFAYVVCFCDVATLEQMRLRQGGLVLQAGFMIMWLASLGTQAISRLTLVVGGAIAIREVYAVLLIRARVVSNWFGDHILEPHR